MKKYLIKIIVTLLLLSTPALAKSSISIGTTMSFLKIDDPNFKYINNNDQLQLSSLNLGLHYQPNKTAFVYSVLTNRILNRGVNRQVRSKNNNNIYTNTTKVIADTIMLGYQIRQFIPSVFLSNVNVDKAILINNVYKHDIKNSFIWGINTTYYLTKNINLTSSIVMPNKKFNINTGIIFGANYIFNL